MDSPAQAPFPAQTSEQAALPDWLRDTQAAPAPGAGSEQLPAWLSDLAGTDAPANELPPAPPLSVPPQPEGDLPDWLRDSQRDVTPSTGGAEQLPPWMAEAGQTPGDAERPSGESPAWLNDLTAEAPAAAEPPAVPDWLSSANDVAPPAPSDTNVPDWLSSVGDSGRPKPSEAESIDLWGPEPGAASQQPSGSASGDETIPDWLRDISAEDTGEITAEPFTFEGAGGPSQRQESAGPPAWLAGGEDSSEGVPDWLRSAVDQSEELAGAAPEMPSVPLWLQDAESQTVDSGAPAAPEASQAMPIPPSAGMPPAAEQDSLPPWLRDQAAQTPAADVPAWLREPDLPSQPPAADVPAWLREPDLPSQPPAADVPAWLREPDLPSQPPAAADVSAADVPAWLQQEPASASVTPAHDQDTLPGVGGGGMAAPPAAPAPPPADDLPDWLRPSAPSPAIGSGQPAAPSAPAGQDLPPWLRDESGQPLPTAGMAGDTKLPAWLRGVPTDLPPAAPAHEPPSPAPTSFDWLDQAAEAESRRGSSENEFFGSTELPAWLRPPEPEQPKEINQADARSLDWLTRLSGIEEPEVVVSTAVVAPKLKPLVERPRSAAQIEALALLQRLAAAPFSEPAPLPAAAQPSVWRRVGVERALYLALLIVLIIGLIVPLPDSFGLAAPPSAPGAAELFAQIDKLSENDIVLVGYEWDARRSSELRPLEDAVLGHLIQRKVKLVLASTDPQGTLLLFDFRDQLEKAGYRKGGEDYILLGYKPGAELALRQFAQDFRGVLMSDFQGNDATISALATGTDPSKPRLTSLGDFSMVMVLADEAQDVQGWMEQVHRSATQVPLAFLLPAETAPVVQPYLSQPRIFHLAGKQGALAYQSLRGDSAVPAAQIARETSQQRLSQLVFIVLLLVGAVIVGASTAAARGRRPA
jgi:hypothetical protein